MHAMQRFTVVVGGTICLPRVESLCWHCSPPESPAMMHLVLPQSRPPPGCWSSCVWRPAVPLTHCGDQWEEEEEGGGVQIAEQLSAPCDLMQPCRGCFIRRWRWLVSAPPLPNELSLLALQMASNRPQWRRGWLLVAHARSRQMHFNG